MDRGVLPNPQQRVSTVSIYVSANGLTTELLTTLFSARRDIQTGADLVRYRLRAEFFASISGEQTTSEQTRILADT